MKRFLLSCFTLLFTLITFAQDEFITTWKTDNPGTSNSSSITIPTFSGETYNYDVDWNNDGNYDFIDIGYTGSVTHDFGSPGTYTIRIRGVFPHVLFVDGLLNGGDKDKILSVDQWGNIQWSSFELAFEGCSNLQINATDAPDLSGVTTMRRAFKGCTSLTQGLSNWNTSTITSMVETFYDASSFNSDISGWNTTSVISMQGMFVNATQFDQNLGGWNVESVVFFGTFLSGTTLSSNNYDALLIGWDAQNLQPNLTVNMGLSTQYCSVQAEAARNNIINSDDWLIIDDGPCPTLNVEDIEFSNIKLYPNPSNSIIRIDGLENRDLNVSIYDISGKEVYTDKNYIANSPIGIKNLYSGIYIVKIEAEGAVKNVKLIKN